MAGGALDDSLRLAAANTGIGKGEASTTGIPLRDL